MSILPLTQAAIHRAALVPPDEATALETEEAPAKPRRDMSRPYKVGDEHPTRPVEEFTNPKKAAS